MMRRFSTSVCIVVENLPVPLDRRVWKEACALRDAGYQVAVICPKGKGYSTSYEVIDNIEIYRHYTVEASGVAGYVVEYSVALIAELILTLRVFGRSKIKILQACNPPDTIFLVALLLRPFGVRFVFDQHDLGPELFEAKFGRRGGLLYKLASFLEWCSYKAADTCVVTNESFKEIAITRGGKSPDDVYVVRNCPDIDALQRSDRDSGRLRDELVVAYVGFMGTQDGLDLLLESIEHVIKIEGRRDAHFMLVGGGTVLADLQASIAEKGLSKYVTLTGQVSHDEVARCLSHADIGVTPDPKNEMNDKLTMIKNLEYMAFSLPIVMFDLKEGRRVAGPAALYAMPNDPLDFAAQLIKLLDDGELRRQLGEVGRRRIEERLNWQNEKATLLRAYESTLPPNKALCLSQD